MVRRFPKTGDFFVVSPFFCCLGCLSRYLLDAVCLGVKVLSSDIFGWGRCCEMRNEGFQRFPGISIAGPLEYCPLFLFSLDTQEPAFHKTARGLGEAVQLLAPVAPLCLVVSSVSPPACASEALPKFEVPVVIATLGHTRNYVRVPGMYHIYTAVFLCSTSYSRTNAPSGKYDGLPTTNTWCTAVPQYMHSSSACSQ